MAATMSSRRTKRPKQIHRFLRAARADATALSVCSTLNNNVNSGERVVPERDAPLGSILLDVMGRILDVVYRLILLVDQDAHLQSHVR